MAALTVQPLTRASNGVDLAGAAASVGGDTFSTTGREMLVVKNGSGAPITVTIATPILVDNLAVADLTATIGAGATRALGPFPPSTYADNGQPGGSVAVSYSAVSSVTVAVVSY